MSIKTAIFSLETVAHLQGHEKLLLPITDEAYSDRDKILDLLTTMEDDIYNKEYDGIRSMIDTIRHILEK